MSVEIKELIIRATVVDTNENKSISTKEEDLEYQEEIIAACVEQVLKILETKKER